MTKYMCLRNITNNRYTIFEDGIKICETRDQNTAHFIITACNCHASLLEARKIVKWYLEEPNEITTKRAFQLLDEAFRKTEETK